MPGWGSGGEVPEVRKCGSANGSGALARVPGGMGRARSRCSAHRSAPVRPASPVHPFTSPSSDHELRRHQPAGALHVHHHGAPAQALQEAGGVLGGGDGGAVDLHDQVALAQFGWRPDLRGGGALAIVQYRRRYGRILEMEVGGGMACLDAAGGG